MFSFSPIYTTADARRLAKKKLPWMVYDYIDGSAGEGLGDQLNRQDIQNLRLHPRVLKNVDNIMLASNLFDV